MDKHTVLVVQANDDDQLYGYQQVIDNVVYSNAPWYHLMYIVERMTHEMVHGFAIPVSSLKWSVREL